MVKIFKPGRVVIVTNGRYSGKKAIVVRVTEDGTYERPYEHALIAGICRYPRKVTKGMSKKKILLRSKIKVFVRLYNLTHLIPTRYTASDIEFDKKYVNKEAAKDPVRRILARRHVRLILQKRYAMGKNRWLFQKLRF